MIDSSFTIIVEGIADKKFISDYLKFLKINFEEDIFFLIEGDVTSKKSRIENKLKKKDINKTFFIIDFDNDKIKYEKTIESILKGLKFSNINNFLSNNIFFFPDDKKTGNLENLLGDILVYPKFNDCFNEYEECVKKIKGFPQDRLPDSKSKIFAYDHTTGGVGKDGKRDYLDKSRYNLSHSSLNKLKKFLENNIIKKTKTTP